MFLCAQELHGVVKRSLYEPFERRLCKSLHHVLPRHFDIAFRRKREQCLLIAERCVDAGGVNAHRLREVRHRRAFVTPFPEQTHRDVEGGFFIESSRSTEFI